jgi:hypothetical protein
LRNTLYPLLSIVKYYLFYYNIEYSNYIWLQKLPLRGYYRIKLVNIEIKSLF